MKKVLLALAIGFAGLQAQAVQSPAWFCTLGFKGTAVGAKLLIGAYHFDGKGSLDCVNPTGQNVTYPVRVTMNAKALSPQISLGFMNLYGRSAQIGISSSRNPAVLLGDYYIAQAQAAVIGGAGIITAVHANDSSVALKVALQLTSGFGINLGMNRMRVTLDEDN